MTRALAAIGLVALALFTLAAALFAVWPSLWRDLLAFIIAEQVQIHRALTGSVSDLQKNPSFTAAVGLTALSFAYGIFHALGPGHGKAVIGSYLLASGDTLRRGVILAFVSALAQGLTAILLVCILIVALGMTARAATANVTWLELASYALMAVGGAFLLYRKAREIWIPLATTQRATHESHHLPLANPVSAQVSAFEPVLQPVGVAAYRSPPDIHHGHNPDCGHVHMPRADLAAKPLGLVSLAGVVGAVGIRPCMGAILVLVFALTHGLFAAGIIAVLAMSIGTAITVSGLAIVTVLARGDGLRQLLGNTTWLTTVHHTLGIAGAAALLILSALFFVAALQAPPTNPLGIVG